MTETPEGAATSQPAREGQRIAKVMARAGLCSRRDAEAWILEGRVTVNGQTLDSPAFNVTAEDDIRVDGERLKEAERTRLFLFHKPRGLVTTARDPEGRPTIFDALPEDLPRVVAVGRLDINTEGLLLVTNDGGLARVLELPATGWLRRYRVRAHGAIDQERLDALRQGVTIEGVHYAGIEARLEREQGSNVWLMMGLREGKNREIKRVLEHLGLSVNRLIRVSFGPFELGDLGEGEVEEIRTRVLRDQLGNKLAKEAGVNFDAEIIDRVAPPKAERPAPRGERAERTPRPDRKRPEREGFSDRRPVHAERREPEPAHIPRKRKHVTALRAEAEAEETTGPRRRIERGATSDRKGREIKVERIMTAGRPERPARSEGRRFAKSGAASEGRAPARERQPFGDRSPRTEGRFSSRGEGRSFEGRAPSREGKPFGDRPPRGEGRPSGRGEGRTFESRGAAGEGRAPSRERKSFGDRPPRSEGGHSSRNEGRSFEGRTPSREGKSFGDRPPRGEGRPSGRGEGRTFESSRRCRRRSRALARAEIVWRSSVEERRGAFEPKRGTFVRGPRACPRRQAVRQAPALRRRTLFAARRRQAKRKT